MGKINSSTFLSVPRAGSGYQGVADSFPPLRERDKDEKGGHRAKLRSQSISGGAGAAPGGVSSRRGAPPAPPKGSSVINYRLGGPGRQGGE